MHVLRQVTFIKVDIEEKTTYKIRITQYNNASVTLCKGKGLEWFKEEKTEGSFFQWVQFFKNSEWDYFLG